MLRDAAGLLADFDQAASSAAIPGWPTPIRHEVLPAPHEQPALPSRTTAVYIFSLSATYGERTPAGADRVLKVGKVGPRSDPRFRSQHYGLSAPSTLAKSLIKHQILWPWLDLTGLDEANVKNWMLENLDRDHFFVAEGHSEVLDALEIFTRGRVGSVFEGAA